MLQTSDVRHLENAFSTNLREKYEKVSYRPIKTQDVS